MAEPVAGPAFIVCVVGYAFVAGACVCGAQSGEAGIVGRAEEYERSSAAAHVKGEEGSGSGGWIGGVG